MGTEQIAPCDCGAAIEGKWAGMHHPNCASLQRKLICHGDGGESERLYGLAVGHVMTEADIADLQNLIADNNDEIGNTSELYHAAYQSALANSAPDKVELINRIHALQGEVSVQKAMARFYRKRPRE